DHRTRRRQRRTHDNGPGSHCRFRSGSARRPVPDGPAAPHAVRPVRRAGADRVRPPALPARAGRGRRRPPPAAGHAEPRRPAPGRRRGPVPRAGRRPRARPGRRHPGGRQRRVPAAGRRHPARHRIPGAAGRAGRRPGVAGPRGPARHDRPGPGHQAGEPRAVRGRQGRGVGRPRPAVRGAAGRPHAGRRGAGRRVRHSQAAPGRGDQPGQGDGPDEHRREAHPPGRAGQRAGRRPGHRPAAVIAADQLRRAGRDPAARQERPAVRAGGDRHGAGRPGAVPRPDLGRARDRPGHRPDRQRQDDDPLRGPAAAQRQGPEHPDAGGPDRVRAGGRQPDAGQREEGADVRQRAAERAAAGPGRDHGRRDPGPGDGHDGHPVRPDRAPRVQH
ncbi:MAG: Type IV fimbrial assembly, ATPase PilB, partial [uncultured Phycisphaerae bacterium]